MNIIKKLFGIKEIGRCAYCGEYGEIKEYYGGYGVNQGRLLGSACCFKCDKANRIKWDEEAIEKEKSDIINPPSKKQKEWIIKRNKLLKNA